MNAKSIPVDKIVLSGSNPRKFIDPDELLELSESIKSTDGLIQPITVRAGDKDIYTLIAGERRLKAYQVLKWPEIPAFIRGKDEISDDALFEMQIIENLQREDIRPLDEADAFRSYTKKFGVEALCKKIAKSESYVVRRMKLLEMIDDLQKMLAEGFINLGHAEVLCRLTPDDQRTVLKNRLMVDNYEIDRRVKLPISEKQLAYWINNNLVHNLSAAPFPKDDPTLNPKMGPCTTCQFRSGYNRTLFGDITEDDRCMNGACFKIKMDNFVLAAFQALKDTKEHFVLYASESLYGPERSDIEKRFKGYPIIHQHDSVYQKSNKKKFIPGETTYGLVVHGNNIGQTIFLEKKKQSMGDQKRIVESGGNVSEAAVKQKISEVKERLMSKERSDRRDVNAQIVAGLEATKLYNLDEEKGIPEDKEMPAKLSKIEKAFFLRWVIEKSELEAQQMIAKLFGRDDLSFYEMFSNDDDDDDSISVEELMNVPENQIAQIFRYAFFSSYSNANVEYNPKFHDMFCTLGREHKVPVDDFWSTQNEKKDKRVANANKKIEDLKKMIKPAKAKKTAPAAKAKKAGKKSGKVTKKKSKPKGKLKDLLDKDFDKKEQDLAEAVVIAKNTKPGTKVSKDESGALVFDNSVTKKDPATVGSKRLPRAVRQIDLEEAIEGINSGDLEEIEEDDE